MPPSTAVLPQLGALLADLAWRLRCGRDRFAGALARRRVPIGFLAGAVVLWLARPTPGSLLTGAGIALVGEGLRIWAAGHLNKSREVTCSGPYRWCAHPLYVGSSILGAGLAVAANDALVAAIVAVYLGATIGAAIRTEEAFLGRRFGEGYHRYRRGGIRVPSRADGRRFTLAQARANREHRAAAGLLVALLLLLLKATYNGAFWRTAGTSLVRPGG